VLKNRGYNFQHNFEHGKKHAGRKDMFFSGMQAALRYVLHEIWRDFPVFMNAEGDLE
jgi:hypothetical protein